MMPAMQHQGPEGVAMAASTGAGVLRLDKLGRQLRARRAELAALQASTAFSAQAIERERDADMRRLEAVATDEVRARTDISALEAEIVAARLRVRVLKQRLACAQLNLDDAAHMAETTSREVFRADAQLAELQARQAPRAARLVASIARLERRIGRATGGVPPALLGHT